MDITVAYDRFPTQYWEDLTPFRYSCLLIFACLSRTKWDPNFSMDPYVAMSIRIATKVSESAIENRLRLLKGVWLNICVPKRMLACPPVAFPRSDWVSLACTSEPTVFGFTVP